MVQILSDYFGDEQSGTNKCPLQWEILLKTVIDPRYIRYLSCFLSLQVRWRMSKLPYYAKLRNIFRGLKAETAVRPGTKVSESIHGWDRS